MIFGVIGFGEIARVHTEHLWALDLAPHSVLVRGSNSISEVEHYFLSNYNYRPIVTVNKEDFFSCPLTHTLICTPPASHFEFLLNCLDRGLSTLVEKPLFHPENWSSSCVDNMITELSLHPNKDFMVNTANSYFAEKISEVCGVDNIQKYKFVFHTHGLGVGVDVLVDLLPHGLGMLNKLFGLHLLDDLSLSKDDTQGSNIKCFFKYANRDVEFDLAHCRSKPKKMEFYINDNKFSRHQAGTGRDYKVSLINHESSDVLPMIDPFTKLIKDFVSGKRRHHQDLWDAKLHGEIVRYAICQGI